MAGLLLFLMIVHASCMKDDAFVFGGNTDSALNEKRNANEIRSRITTGDSIDNNPAHNFLAMLDPANGLAPRDPARMAVRIIESVDMEPAPMRMVLGSGALDSILNVLRKRIADFETQTKLAASTDFPPGE